MAISPRTGEDLIKDVVFFNALTKEELGFLSDHAEIRKVAKGAALFSEKQKSEGLFIVRTGEIKVLKSGKEGREQIIYLARPGRLIVEGIRFDGGDYGATAHAMRQATVLLLSNTSLETVGDKRPQLYKALVNLRAQRADKHLRLVSDLSLRTVPERLASFLLSLVESRRGRGEDMVHLMRDLTTETVAGRLGTVREEISRGLAYLEREGAIVSSPEMIEVVDMPQLTAVAQGKVPYKKPLVPKTTKKKA